jgi:hypothetical protein
MGRVLEVLGVRPWRVEVGVIVVMWVCVRGETAVATVERCVTTTSADSNGNTHEETSRYGSWVVRGVRHPGEIYGAGTGDQARRVPVPVQGNSAIVADAPRQMVLVGAFMLGLLLLGTGVMHYQFARVTARRERRR